MKKFIKQALAALLIVPTLALGAATLAPAPAYAQCTPGEYNIGTGADCAQGDETPSNLFDGDSAIFKTVVNILLFLIGAIAVIMLIIGGIRYVVSAGDSSAVTGAKNTILYAVIGIIVAVLAYAIVNWVIGALPSN